MTVDKLSMSTGGICSVSNRNIPSGFIDINRKITRLNGAVASLLA